MQLINMKNSKYTYVMCLQCHAVVNPVPFLSACHESWCEERRTNCRELEAYARECETSGVCLDWRSEDLCPYSCPPGTEYRYIGSIKLAPSQ